MKKLISLVLAVVLCLTLLAGCGGTTSNTSEEADTIKVGFIGPLTGATSQYGEAVRNGAKLYFEKVNADGGINGKKIEFICYDSQGDKTEATNAYTRLVDQDGIVALIGSVLTGETFAVAELVGEDLLPAITASATGDELTDIGTTYFRTCYKDSFQGGKMADYINEFTDVKKVAVIVNNGSDYSVGLAKAFTDECKVKGIEVVANESYGDTDTEFGSQLDNIVAAHPDALYCPDYYQVVYEIAKQAKQHGLNVPFYGGDGYDGLLEVENCDATLLEGFTYTNHFAAQAEIADPDFFSNYETAFNVKPISFSYLAYDAAMILVDALKGCETLDRAEIVDAIRKTDLDCLTGHYTFDENGNPVKLCAMVYVKDGETLFDKMY